MKRFLFSVLLVLAVQLSFAQVNYWIFGNGGDTANLKGTLKVNSAFYIPIRDTNFTPMRIGAETRRPQDSLKYSWNGRKWGLSENDPAAVNSLIASNTLIKNTIASLRALTSVVAAQLFYLNDPNIGGTFYWDQTDVTSADDGVNIIVTAGGARLKRISDIPEFTSIAAMRASTAYQRKLPVYTTLSYYGDGDVAAAGLWKFSDTSTHADDSCLFVKPAGVGAGPGRYVYIPVNSIYNLRSLGCKADNATDISWRANYVMANTPFGSNVKLPSGTYYSAYTLNVPSTAIKLFGDGIHGTQINFPASVIGVKILKQNSSILQHGFQTLADLFINANAKDGTDGVDQYSVASSPYCATWYRYHGVEVENVCTVNNVYVANFSGNGFNNYGTLAGIGSNVSGAVYYNVHVKQCSGSSFCINGGDANGIVLINPDFRDCPGAAIYDSSAFGVVVMGALMHNCGSLQIPGFGTEGYYVQWSLSGQSKLDGYFEGSSANSNCIQGYTSVEGFIGSSFLGTFVQVRQGAVVNKIFARTDGQGVSHLIGLMQRDSTLDAMFIRATNAGAGNNFIGLTEQNYGLTEGRGIYSLNWHEQANKARNQPPFMQRWGADDKVTTNGTLNRGWRNYIGGVGLTSPMIGDRFIQSAPNTTAIIPNPYKPGDLVYNNTYDPTKPPGWICLTAGSVGPAVTAQGKTGAASNKIVLSAQSTILQEMDSILISGNAMRVTAKNRTEDTLTVSPAPPTISTFSAISYVAPTWAAFGQGFGNTTSRPSLSTNDKGFWYYNTDSSRNEYWTGTVWNQLTAAGGGGGGSYTFPYTVIAPSSAIQLTNDSVAAANYYYGNPYFGVRPGWYKLPLVPDGTGNFAMGGAFATTRLYFNNNAGTSSYFIQNNGGNFRYDGASHAFWANNVNVFNLNSTGTIGFPNLNGTGNRIPVLDLNGTITRGTIDPANVAQLASPTFTGTATVVALKIGEWGVSAANFTVAAEGTDYELPDLTAAAANFTFSLPAASSNTGRIIYLLNLNSNATYHWTFGSTVKDLTGATITTITNNKAIILISNGTDWHTLQF